MNFVDIKQNIWQKKEKNKILIAAHRGTCGGNIVRNTIPAYENALKHGADIIELDVIMSMDGDFYTFHNGYEKVVIGVDKDIRTMTTKEIESYTCINDAGIKISQKIEKLQDVLEHLKGKCLINIDRSWFYWNETIKVLQKHNMADQIILKSHADERLLKTLQDSNSHLMYMPIVDTKEKMDLVMKYQLNLIASELIFRDLHSPLIKEEHMQQLKSKSILTWANAITLDDDIILSAGLDDNRAIIENEDENWGKLIDMGFDILQTDWPLLLKQYVNRKNI